LRFGGPNRGARRPLGQTRSLPRVTTWDYTTTVITHGLLGRKEEELDRGEFERAMNELGAEGWELATAFLDVALHREKDGHVLVFKRRHE
jgi:hypothetical protein